MKNDETKQKKYVKLTNDQQDYSILLWRILICGNSLPTTTTLVCNKDPSV